MKIPRVLKESLSQSIPGKSKLRLFKSITGTDDKQPTIKQAWKYIEKVADRHFPFAELFTYILTEGRYNQLDFSAIKQCNDVDGILKELEKYPQKEPLLFEIKNFMGSESSVCAWVRCELIHDSSGHFYTIILCDEKTFPEKVIFYTEIRTSQLTPNPAVIFHDSKGQVIKLKRGSKKIGSNKLVSFCVNLMAHISRNNPGAIVPLERLDHTSARDYAVDTLEYPTDAKLMRLLKKLRNGETVCSVAQVKLSEVVPFSYDYCLKIPLVMINFAERHLEETVENGILVYWEDNKFIMSDCYGTYLAARKANLDEVTAIIIGDSLPNHIVVKKCGGPELLPPLLTMQTPNYDSLQPEMKDLILQRYLDRLSTLTNASDIINARCLLLTEDSNTKPLENLLLSNNFNINETLIWSYKGCSNFVSLEATIRTVKKINPRVVIIVHRDRDYLSVDHVTQIEDRIVQLGAIAFVTDGTDMESNFIRGIHIQYLNPTVSLATVEEVIEEAYKDAKEHSIECLKKNIHSGMNFEALYTSDKKRFSHGKKTLSMIQTRLQRMLKKNPKIFEPSPFIDNSTLQDIAVKIWE